MSGAVRSFAKINLGLHIGATRADGFHELLTIYQTIALHDVIRLSVERGTGIEIRCEDPRVPKDESNTCFQVAEKMLRALRRNGRVIIEIDKRLPVQGGLGGASSNAAATMLALEQALGKSLPDAERFRIATEVGSDVPLFLVGGTVLGLGRGEQVYPLQDLPPLPCVIVTPEIGVSTPKAFAQWDRSSGADNLFGKLKADSSHAAERRSSGGPEKNATRKRHSKLTGNSVSDRMSELGCGLSAWLSGRHSGAPVRGRAENPLLALVRAGIENDFEQVVFPEFPELREVKRALVRAGAKYASLSGSGSALYGLFVSRAEAVRAAGRLTKQGWTAQATSILTRSQYWQRIFRS